MLLEDSDILTVMVGINDVYKYYRDGGEEDFDVTGWMEHFPCLCSHLPICKCRILFLLPTPDDFTIIDRVRLYSIKHSIAVSFNQSVGEFVAVKVMGIYLPAFQNQA